MLLHRFIRSTTIRRNVIGCRPTRCLPTSQLLSFCQVCQNRVSQSRGSLQCFVFVRVTSWIVFLFSAQGTIHEITRIRERAGKCRLTNGNVFVATVAMQPNLLAHLSRGQIPSVRQAER